MKVAIWSVFALLAACWTGLVAVSVQLTEWLFGLVASGQVSDVAASAAQWPVPAWLALWVDPAWVQSLQAAWLGLVQWLAQVLPSAGSVDAWITPLLWTGWGLGMLCLLVPAIALHWLTGRWKTNTPTVLRPAR